MKKARNSSFSMNSRIKSDVKKLFEYWCELVPAHATENPSAVGRPAGVIVESFPKCFRDEKTIDGIPTFAYPCEMEGTTVESYSFVMTTEQSKWRFGFCRHDPNTNTALVILTHLPWHSTFFKLITLLAELRRTDKTEFTKFLTAVYSADVPLPGRSLTLSYNDGQNSFTFDCPPQFQLPSIPDNHNLNLYYNFVYPKNMIAVFAAMLAERRIIFTSHSLDRLSSCVQAANAFLYPLVWQHIFIPVLPMKLKDYLSAPIPYLIGVPEAVLKTMTPDELGDVVILNCDTKMLETPFDDVHDMPSEIVSHLKKQLAPVHSSDHMGDRVSKIFLGVLVQLIGGYRDAVEGKKFNHERFIESRPSHLRPFLGKMMELQCFSQFIDERIEMVSQGQGLSDEFELETVRYQERMKKRSRVFLKNIKDKTNPAVKSAVKSVKESSRGVKTAYKDLKSKFRDITPPSNAHFRSHLSSNSQHDRIDGYVVVNSKLSTPGSGHHSAPSSPIFSKRLGGLLSSSTTTTSASAATGGGFQYATPDEINGASQSIRRAAPPLAMSSSSSSANIHANGYAHAAHDAARSNSHLAASPTVSPASSLCSSEMNLSQELQNHPLFKSPIVDRSSLRSLQPQHLQAAHTTDTLLSAAQSVASSQDLITLDDSNNASFDLEDFDPLNQNARPMPVHAFHAAGRKKSTTLPTGTSATFMAASTTHTTGISNPLYPYFAPRPAMTQQPPPPPTPATPSQQARPPPLPTTKPPPMPADDDFELLRKYGLDQFSLTTVASALPGTATNTNGKLIAATGTPTTTMLVGAPTMTGGMRNWTTFD